MKDNKILLQNNNQIPKQQIITMNFKPTSRQTFFNPPLDMHFPNRQRDIHSSIQHYKTHFSNLNWDINSLNYCRETTSSGQHWEIHSETNVGTYILQVNAGTYIPQTKIIKYIL